MTVIDQSDKPFDVEQVSPGQRTTQPDNVAIEEPMEIRLVFGSGQQRIMRSLSITMRTPGHDQDLAVGFLLTEGILNHADQIDQVHTRGVDHTGQATGNVLRVELRPDVKVDLNRLQRHFYTSSSCGVCGKASLEALEVQGLTPIVSDTPRLSAEIVNQLPDRLRANQPAFDKTGGLHAAGLANADGEILAVREDVGRHNAVDKLVGHYFLKNEIPLDQGIVVVSGRASFEIMQKILVARIPVLIAVGAPSTLAVEMAREYQMTLVGFASPSRFNIYSGGHRITD